MIGAEKATDLDDALPWNRAENMAESFMKLRIATAAYEFKGVAIMNLLTSATTDNQRTTTGGKNVGSSPYGFVRLVRAKHIPSSPRAQCKEGMGLQHCGHQERGEGTAGDPKLECRLRESVHNDMVGSSPLTVFRSWVANHPLCDRVWILRSARKREFSKAAEYYTKSTESFPEDDEKRVYFLTLALETLWGREAPVKETLPVVEKAKKSIPKMKKIWEHSAMSKRREASITLMLQFEKQVRKALKSGRMTIDGVAKPQMP
ncbi:coq1 hexaprenyl diphosphate synthase [Salix suchowensis]|nr:coq1 hexaprenyl diphosphate synthase [Salix suchowensis]